MYFERRICSFTSRPIDAKDRASIQLLLVDLDNSGRMTEDVEIFDICGSIRESGQSDALLMERLRAK